MTDCNAVQSKTRLLVRCDNCLQDSEFYCGYGLPNNRVLRFCSIKCRREYCDAHELWMPKTDR